MPDRDVKTLRHLIWYQYAKIIAKRALGPEAKSQHYGFVKQTLKDLMSGRKTWSDITREDKQLVEAERRCVYCGSDKGLAWEHIVPKTLRINERCANCDTIQAIHNQVWTCTSCNSGKGTLGLYAFYRKRLREDRKFYDRIPPLVEKKYLKTVYQCLEQCTEAIDSEWVVHGRQPTVLDIDEALRSYGRL
jgi:ribosomal protein S27AE